jgi:hypothetical protein
MITRLSPGVGQNYRAFAMYHGTTWLFLGHVSTLIAHLDQVSSEGNTSR